MQTTFTNDLDDFTFSTNEDAVSLSLFLVLYYNFFYLSMSIILFLSIYVYYRFSIYPWLISFSVFYYVSFYIFLCLLISLWLCLYHYTYVLLFLYLSFYQCPSISLSIILSVFLFLHHSFYVFPTLFLLMPLLMKMHLASNRPVGLTRSNSFYSDWHSQFNNRLGWQQWNRPFHLWQINLNFFYKWVNHGDFFVYFWSFQAQIVQIKL